MCRLAGGYIDLDKKYGAAFQGDHNALIRNIVTCKRSTTHHCPDCEAKATKKCFRDLHLAYCGVCGERFAMWSAGCNIHPYNHEFNLIFKAVRDNWPAKRCHDLDPDFVIEEAQEEEQKDPFNFKDIVPSFIGDESGPEFANEYGLLMVANLAKLKQQLVIFQLSINDTPSQLKGRAANDAKKARAATTRLANRKKGAEVEAAEAAAKMAKAASKTKKKPGRKNDVAEAEALAQAAQEKRNRRAPGVRPAYASTRC